MEPLLSEPYKLIEMVGPYVRDSIWIGDMNFTSLRHPNIERSSMSQELDTKLLSKPLTPDIEDGPLQILQKTNCKIIEIVANLRKNKYASLIHWKESIVGPICLKCGISS